MPKHVKARAGQDEQEEQQVRKLAKSHHAPADWKFHARMVVQSWAGKTPNEIAGELGCHPQTVRIHLARFTTEGIAGLGMRAGSGRQPRLSEQERSRILAPSQASATRALADASRCDDGGPRRGGISTLDAQCAGPGGCRSGDPGQRQPDSAHLPA
jgi:hypothetical protein